MVAGGKDALDGLEFDLSLSRIGSERDQGESMASPGRMDTEKAAQVGQSTDLMAF
jgi:hypothetical protein